jgi:ectoine hydroxylase-related dioxygenase (phytanoyl-CoA dioxygenase family)
MLQAAWAFKGAMKYAVDEIESTGFALCENAINQDATASLIHGLESAAASRAALDRNGSTFAIRNLLRDHAIIRQLADSPAIRSLIDPILGPSAIAVRGILFDKTPGANWKVPWHQDLSIAVTERIDLPGYGPWSMKAAVPHVQPPVEILQNMLTVRLHLDDCGADNGPLLVLPGSHAHGILNGGQIEKLRSTGQPIACTVNRGGAVLMRPLLLHASHSATSPNHRRVIHLEFASDVLPPPLRWFIA